jgi:hypothetical protein
MLNRRSETGGYGATFGSVSQSMRAQLASMPTGIGLDASGSSPEACADSEACTRLPTAASSARPSPDQPAGASHAAVHSPQDADLAGSTHATPCGLGSHAGSPAEQQPEGGREQGEGQRQQGGALRSHPPRHAQLAQRHAASIWLDRTGHFGHARESDADDADALALTRKAVRAGADVKPAPHVPRPRPYDSGSEEEEEEEEEEVLMHMREQRSVHDAAAASPTARLSSRGAAAALEHAATATQGLAPVLSRVESASWLSTASRVELQEALVLLAAHAQMQVRARVLERFWAVAAPACVRACRLVWRSWLGVGAGTGQDGM